MLLTRPTDLGVMIWWIISHYDSVMRVLCPHPNPNNPKTKGMLPEHILQLIYKVNPSHQVKVVAKYWYQLKNQSVSQSTMKGEIASPLKWIWGYMLKQNQEGKIQQSIFTENAVANHMYNDHQYCSEWSKVVQAKKKVICM